MKKLILLSFVIGCEETLNSSCDEYIDYICSCHEDNPDYDCGDLANIYSDPDSEQIAECDLALDEQKELDSEAQMECEL